MKVKVKICGITCKEDATFAAESGADFLGFIFAESPRKILPETAKKIISEIPSYIIKVGVFVDTPLNEIKEIMDFAGLDLIQFHGDYKPETVSLLKDKAIKVFRVGGTGKPDLPFPAKYYLFDTFKKNKYGGTGKTFNWTVLDSFDIDKPFFLSGGLGPDNIIEAVKKTEPFAVDISSGIEKSPGIKDHDMMKELFKKINSLLYNARDGRITFSKGVL